MSLVQLEGKCMDSKPGQEKGRVGGINTNHPLEQSSRYWIGKFLEQESQRLGELKQFDPDEFSFDGIVFAVTSLFPIPIDRVQVFIPALAHTIHTALPQGSSINVGNTVKVHLQSKGRYLLKISK
eukprot:TRINITY_DN4836_c0_g1_i3.p1 TRINITY_DN4836_c0_g1~~TRINITY_DN4836_c0_g1_i3.p1  ORF type:complete len:125 (-),score=24.45 TRINITY_DN4836_c0_g1_i3:50-424(-)